MPDLVVTVPKHLWAIWLDEGDLPGQPYSGEVSSFYTAPHPDIQPGERLYIVSHGRLRGYAPVWAIGREHGRWAIFRKGGAVACTIPEPIRGFQGWRKRWWRREAEVAFPDWQTAGVR